MIQVGKEEIASFFLIFIIYILISVFVFNRTSVHRNNSNMLSVGMSAEKSNSNVHSKNIINSSSSVEELVEQCMKAASLDLIPTNNSKSSLLQQAKENANYFFDQLRKLIPQDPLAEHKYNHCWKMNIKMQWTKENGYAGLFGDNNFTFQGSRIIKPLKYSFACLPNVYLAGFPKCGSTYLHCAISRLILVLNQNRTIPLETELRKEPRFWTFNSHSKGANIHPPGVHELVHYLINYFPGVKKMSENNDNGIVLHDGSPGNIYLWPRFSTAEDDLTNYCILPSVLPKLLPNSKYIVITRNQADMLYSQYWFSCTSAGIKLPSKVKLKGPDTFHDRVTTKIKIFMKCMRANSPPATSHFCESLPGLMQNYMPCILQGKHVLDKCLNEIFFENFTREMPCGRINVQMGAYFVHIHKWLSVVPRDRFLFLRSEDVFTRFEQIALDISKFLNIAPILSPKNMKRVKESVEHCQTNSNNFYKKDPRLRMRRDTSEILEAFYLPFNQLLEEILQHTS